MHLYFITGCLSCLGQPCTLMSVAKPGYAASTTWSRLVAEKWLVRTQRMYTHSALCLTQQPSITTADLRTEGKQLTDKLRTLTGN
jgi:hypothetical protein